MAVVLLLPAGALAHTRLEGSRPADGSRLARAPAAVIVDYSAPLANVVEASITVDGEEIAGPARLSARDAGRVRIPITDRGRTGRFSVRWVVQSADAHQLEGSIGFAVPRPRLADVVAPIARALLASSNALAEAAAAAERRATN